MSNLADHAKAELEREDLFGDGDFYGGLMGKGVMELIEVFSKQGHSGMSGGIAIHLFCELANFRALSPLTDDPNEWREASSEGVHQNVRNGSCFSYDGGKTYYSLDEKRQWLRKLLPWDLYRKLPTYWKHPRHHSEKVAK